MRIYYVYILTNRYNTVFYTGVTNNIVRRYHEHKNKIFKGFTSRYNIYKLVYFEEFQYINSAIFREKQVKRYSREKKYALINSVNPGFSDLASDWTNK